MKLVSDTGPIIGLAKIGKLTLLEKCADEIFIPPMVYKELFGKIGPESEEIDKALNSFIKTVSLPQTEGQIRNAISGLDEGEKQAITLAYTRIDNVVLLIDDRAGREVAEKLGIPITGLIGLILRLKEKGFVQNIGAIVEELRRKGYWLSDDVVEMVKRLSGE